MSQPIDFPTYIAHRSRKEYCSASKMPTPLLYVGGELDIAFAPELRDALQVALKNEAPSLALEFSEVTFIDSECMKVLLAAQQAARDLGREICLVNPSEVVRRTLTILRLGAEFPIYRVPPNAIRRLPGSGGVC